MSVISEADLTQSLNNLAPTFRTAINATIDAESQPLKRVQTQKDEINVRKGIYTDIKKNMDALQSAVLALISTQASFALKLSPSAAVMSGNAGASVLSASASETALFGEYDFAVSKLARAQTQATAAAASPDIALGKSGVFWLGGTGTAAVSDFTPGDSLSGVETSSVASEQRELGSGSYSVQVRESSGIRQFRLVNADGKAVSIRSKDGSGYTTNWQDMGNGSSSFDTGRGLTLTLNSTGTLGSTSFSYSAKGASINISASDTQRTIVNMINGAVQPEGRDFKASVVGGKLLLTGTQTGTNHSLVYQDSAGLGFSNVQDAQNALFTVNGMEISRSTNTNLTDVIEGATINLASDAEGKTAHLSISGNLAKAAAPANALVNAFNAAFTHLTQKMAVTSSTVGDKTTYSRGPLAGDLGFRSLRMDMMNTLSGRISNSGAFKSLADIGFSFDKDLKLSVDTAKFTNALTTQGPDLTALLDAAMGKFNQTLSVYTSSSGSLQSSMNSMEEQMKSFDQRIDKYNASLLERKQSLINQYQQMQSTLAELGYQAQMFGVSLTGSSSSGINILG